MRRCPAQLPHARSAPCRHYSEKLRGPLNSNKQLLADLTSIKREALDRNNDAQHEDVAIDAQGPAEHPYVQAHLPQSPLMFKYVGRKSPQTKVPKPKQQEAELSPFQQELRANPLARTLASPVRMCRLTAVRLPSDFLLQHGLSTHPQTGKKWNLPLLAGRSSFPKDETMKKDVETATDKIGELAQGNPTRAPTRTLSGFNIISSYEALDLISSEKTSKKHRELIPQSWKEAKGIGKGSLVWREDMADFTLGLLRKQIVDDMERLLATAPITDVIPCDEIVDIRAESAVSSIMCFSAERTADARTSPAMADHLQEEATSMPDSWATISHQESKVPIFFMKALLGPASLATLRARWPQLMGKDFAAFQRKQRTAGLQSNLWKLAGYLG